MDPTITNINIQNLKFMYIGKDAVTTQTVGGRNCQADRYLYQIQHYDGWIMEIGYHEFENGSKDVRCVGCSDMTPPQLHRLNHGLRMSVTVYDGNKMKDLFWSELSQARINNINSVPVWANLVKANEKQLNSSAGFNVRGFIESIIEFDDFGTREAVLGDDSNRRNYLCASYKLDTLRAPLSCYTITRIVPLLSKVKKIIKGAGVI